MPTPHRTASWTADATARPGGQGIQRRRTAPRAARTAWLVLPAAVVGAVVAACWATPAPAERASAAVTEARRRLLDGDAAGAVAAADLAVAALPSERGPRTFAALARAAAGDLPAALARLEREARGAPHDPAAAFEAGLAASALARVHRRQPGRERLAESLSLAARDWWTEAARRADTAPGNARAAVVGSCAEIALGRPRAALRRIERARPPGVRQDDERTVVLAAALAACGDTAAARRVLAAALAASPTPRLADALARLRARTGPADESPHLDGLRAWARGDAAAAAAALSARVDARPDDPVALAVLARALVALDRRDEAARRFDSLAARDPRSPAAPYFRGSLLLAERRFDDATRAFDLAAERAPRDPSVLRGRADAWLGAFAAARASRGEAADASFDADAVLASARRPDDPLPAFARGCVAESRGDLRAAAGWYRAALDRAPDFGLAANNLGSVLAALGRRAEAVAASETAARLLPGSPLALDTLRAARGAPEGGTSR